MNYRKTIGILLTVFALSVVAVAPALADPPGCRNAPFGFSHSHTVEFWPGDWAIGSHSFQMRVSFPDSGVIEFNPVNFEVTEEAPLYPGQVLLRFWGLVWLEGVTPAINPYQDTVMQLSWTYEEDRSVKEIRDFRDAIAVEFRWDGSEYINVAAGPIVSSCSFLNTGHFFRTWGARLK